MAPKPRSPGSVAACLAEVQKHNGNISAAARALGIPRPTLQSTIRDSGSVGVAYIKGRKEIDVENGIVIAFADCHYWPGEPSTAHRALVRFCKRLKPSVVVANGDVLDAASISRHPPIGHNQLPTVKEEIEVCQERLGEIAKAAFKAKKFWALGNHDARFETRLATVAPEFRDVHGTSLQDHFSDWTGCWSLFVNNRPGGLVLKHRMRGGTHAPFNNAVYSGRSTATGHLHSQKITPFSDYNSTRYGVDLGCIADPYGGPFQDYMEDGPRDWRSGFGVFTFVDGMLLMPELVSVVKPGVIQFRGELISV